MKKRSLILILILAACYSYGQAPSVPAPTAKEPSDSRSHEADTIEQTQEVLAYGIQDEILNALAHLEQDQFEALQSDLQTLFTETNSSAIREALFGLYKKYERSDLQEQALSIIDDYTNVNRTLVQAAISYIAKMPPSNTESVSSQLQKIITTEEQNSDYSSACIVALGEIGSPHNAPFLIDYFENFTSDDQYKELYTRQAIVAALEKIHSADSWDFLYERAQDETENPHIRASAASGLAQIGKPDVADVLTQFFESPEPLLRTAAIKGLAAFNTAETQKLLLQGFKDSYYKVRLEAMQTVQKTNNTQAAAYVLYRAKSDPVEEVRLAAVETLALLNTPEGNTWLSETFKDSKKSEKMRAAVLRAVLNHNAAVVAQDLDSVIIPLVSDARQKKLRYEFGKALSKAETSATAALCEAYLQSDDALTKSIGLDMFKTNRYAQVKPIVEAIAQDEKQGALQRRAQQLIK